MYNGMILADAHCDSVLRALDGHDLTRKDPDCQIDLAKLRAGGVDLQFFALWTSPSTVPRRASERLCSLLAETSSLVLAGSGMIAPARSHSDFEANLSESKTSIVLAIEGAHCLAPGEASIDLCHDIGVRIITLCWNNSNWLGTSAAQADTFAHGLTPLGRAGVRRMSELGIIVDVSHASERMFWDVAEVCDKPFIASHSCARALRDHPRNLDDEQIRAIAYANGVVGVNFCPAFLRSGPGASIDDVIAHIEYILALVGDNHVCFGSDFDGIRVGPEGLENVSKFPAIVDRLLERGHTEATVRKVAGENLLRVFREVCG